MPINTEIKTQAFFKKIRAVLQLINDVDITVMDDYTRYLKKGQSVAQLIDFNKPANWAVYPERGSNEGYFINLEIHQGLHARCPIIVIRSHEEAVSKLMPIISTLFDFLDELNPAEIFSFEISELSKAEL